MVVDVQVRFAQKLKVEEKRMNLNIYSFNIDEVRKHILQRLMSSSVEFCFNASVGAVLAQIFREFLHSCEGFDESQVQNRAGYEPPTPDRLRNRPPPPPREDWAPSICIFHFLSTVVGSVQQAQSLVFSDRRSSCFSHCCPLPTFRFHQFQQRLSMTAL
jgi:hypothetical protein